MLLFLWLLMYLFNNAFVIYDHCWSAFHTSVLFWLGDIEWYPHLSCKKDCLNSYQKLALGNWLSLEYLQKMGLIIGVYNVSSQVNATCCVWHFWIVTQIMFVKCAYLFFSLQVNSVRPTSSLCTSCCHLLVFLWRCCSLTGL